MADLHGIHEDVRFDWAAAAALAAELRATATVCDGQVGRRQGFAEHALQEWRGVFADQFRGRMSTCAGDAHRLAAAMREAAEHLDELARLAHEEQNRREQARAWQYHHDHKSVLDHIEDFFTGDDDKPPVPPPITPPSFVATAAVSGGRG